MGFTSIECASKEFTQQGVYQHRMYQLEVYLARSLQAKATNTECTSEEEEEGVH